jgi:hypothetical protein
MIIADSGRQKKEARECRLAPLDTIGDDNIARCTSSTFKQRGQLCLPLAADTTSALSDTDT